MKAPDLVAFVRSLGDHACLRDALGGSGLAEPRQASYLKALDSLLAADMIVEKEPVDDRHY